LAHPRYEFYSPADYAIPSKQRFAANLELLMGLRRPPASGEDSADSLMAAVSAETEFLDGYKKVLSHAPVSEVSDRFDAALARAPWNESLRVRILSQYWHLSQRYSNVGDYRSAVVLMQRGLAVYGERALNWAEYALVLRALGEMGQAIEAGRRAVALDPGLVAGRKVLAETLLATGKRAEASEHLRAVLKIDPHDADARRMLTGF